MPDVTIVDYGCGNIYSLMRAVEACGYKAHLSCDHKKIMNASSIILPGVGAFGHCINRLKSIDLTYTLQEYIKSGRPVLGICVGMQMLMDKSYEQGVHSGLNVIPGKVNGIEFDLNNISRKVPFVGWAKLNVAIDQYTEFSWVKLFHQKWFYFVHSFVAQPKDAKNILANYNYYEDITAIITKENVIGCQFHPEKSGKQGLSFINNFLKHSKVRGNNAPDINL